MHKRYFRYSGRLWLFAIPAVLCLIPAVVYHVQSVRESGAADVKES